MDTMTPNIGISFLLFGFAMGQDRIGDAARRISLAGAESLSPISSPFVFNPGCRNQIDIAYLVDATGSMRYHIQGVKDAAANVSQVCTLLGLCCRQAFVGYRDAYERCRIPNPIPSSAFSIKPFTSSVPSFQSFVQGVTAFGGGDCPEDVFGGLEKAGQLRWNRRASKRVLLHIADAPAHGEQYGGCSRCWNNGDPAGRSLARLLRALKNHRVTYIFGQVNPAATRLMIQKFSQAWGSPIPQFPMGVPGAPSWTCCPKKGNPLLKAKPSDRELVSAMERASMARARCVRSTRGASCRDQGPSVAELITDAVKKTIE